MTKERTYDIQVGGTFVINEGTNVTCRKKLIFNIGEQGSVRNCNTSFEETFLISTNHVLAVDCDGAMRIRPAPLKETHDK